MIKEQRDCAIGFIEQVMNEAATGKTDCFEALALQGGTFLHYAKTGSFLNRDEMAECLKEGFPGPLLKQVYRADDLSRFTCVVSGNFVFNNDKGTESGMISAVFVKNKEDGRITLSSMHVSKTASLVTIARQAKEETLSVTDTSGSLYVLSMNSVIYVQCCRNYLDIHTEQMNEPIRIRSTLYAFRKKLSDNFVMIGRSYLVNNNKIMVVSGDSITLNNNEKLTVSKEIRRIMKKQQLTVLKEV